jgi:hypothetical protein
MKAIKRVYTIWSIFLLLLIFISYGQLEKIDSKIYNSLDEKTFVEVIIQFDKNHLNKQTISDIVSELHMNSNSQIKISNSKNNWIEAYINTEDLKKLESNPKVSYIYENEYKTL